MRENATINLLKQSYFCKRYALYIIIFSLSFILSACNNQSQSAYGSSEMSGISEESDELKPEVRKSSIDVSETADAIKETDKPAAEGVEVRNEPKADEETVTEDMVLEKYYDFMNGKSYAIGQDYRDNISLSIDEIFAYYGMLNSYRLTRDMLDESNELKFFNYAFLDMTEDGLSELILKIGGRYIIITYKDAGLYAIWDNEGVIADYTILNNGCVFSRHLTAKTYYYQSFDSVGESHTVVTFSIRTISEDDTRFYFNDEQITEEEWDLKIKPYFDMRDNEEVKWKEFVRKGLKQID